MKIEFEVDDRVISEFEGLKALTGSADYKELFNNALGLLAWATQQRIAGRSVGSIDANAKEYTTLQMPALEYAALASTGQIPNLKAA